MFTNHSSTQKNLFSILVLGLSICASAWGGEAPCASAVPLDLGATWRGPADAAGAAHCLEIDVPARGFLTFDVSTPGAETRAVLEAVGATHGTYLKRAADGVVVLAPKPGTYRFRVLAEDARRELPTYKARVGFLGRAGTKDEDNGEIEVEPDPITYCGALPSLKDEDNGEIEVEPDPQPLLDGSSLKDEDDGEIEVEPDPAVHCAQDLAAVSALFAAKLAAVCGQGEVDDHGDAPLCATPVALDAAVAGEIGNGRGDDEDVFRFHLSEPRTVEITSAGTTDTSGELHDRFGHRLAHDEDGAGDGNFRIVRALSPGTYFVRVEGGRGAAGSYSVSVTTVR